MKRSALRSSKCRNMRAVKQHAASILGATVPFFFEGAICGPYEPDGSATSPAYVNEFVTSQHHSHSPKRVPNRAQISEAMAARKSSRRVRALRDATGRRVAYVYGRDGPWNSPSIPAPLTMDEAQQMARAIVKLSEVAKDDTP